MKILLIDDQVELLKFLKKILENEGHIVSFYEDISPTLKNNFEWDFDLIILDLMLPGKPGSYLVKHLQKKKIQIPILVLSALDEAQTKSELLNLGADDYLAKPFDSQELLARIRAIHRRCLDFQYLDKIEIGHLTFYPQQNKIMHDQKDIFLTSKEAALLYLLIQNQGKTVQTKDILQKVWRANPGFHSNVVQATVHRLREKTDFIKPAFLHNVHGIGYRFSIE